MAPQIPDRADLIPGGAVLLFLAGLYVRKWLRSRAKDRSQSSATYPRPMSMMSNSAGAPLITVQSAGSGFGAGSPVTSPSLFSYHDSPPLDTGAGFSESDHSSTYSRPRAYSTSPSLLARSPSPYSSQSSSDHSHMPVLSADGHLLPVLTSTSTSPEQAWSESSHGSSRILPQAPVHPYQNQHQHQTGGYGYQYGNDYPSPQSSEASEYKHVYQASHPHAPTMALVPPAASQRPGPLPLGGAFGRGSDSMYSSIPGYDGYR